MNRLLISTAFVGLLAFAGAAMAQPADDRDHHAAPAGGHAPAAHAPAARAPAAAPAAGMDHRPPSAGNAMRSRGAAPPAAAMRGPGPGQAMRGPAPGGAMRSPGPAMAMHGPAPAAHNFSAYNRNVTAAHHFHAPAYHRPNGWYAHRWSYGEMLPSLFWTQDLWINDYVDFGLMPPPPGTVWVRDGDDAILIDQGSGEIIQVNYGVFY